MTIDYPSVVGTMGTSYATPPRLTQVSPTPLAGAIYVYVTQPGFCQLPPGLTLDPATGVIAGVPTTTFFQLCNIYVTVTTNGVSWSTTTAATLQVTN